MPFLQIFTNVKEADVPADFFSNLTSVFSKAIGKPEKYICVHLADSQKMSYGGSTDPCAVANITSIGNLGVEENKAITKIITTEMAKIAVRADRMFVIYRDIADQDIG